MTSMIVFIGMLTLAFDIPRAECAEPPSTEWTKTYGGTGYDGAYSVVETSDGGYALAGGTRSFGAGSSDFWLVKVDSSGNHEWNKTYGGAKTDWGESVVETGDGGYALAGSTGSFGAGFFDFWLVKVRACVLPNIEILSPENKTYPENNVPVTFTVDKPTDWIGYSLDGQMNVTISGNTTIVGLSEGVHTITVYANDTAGNMGFSDTVYFTVDTVSPNIEVLSPESKTYATSFVSLSFTVNETTSWIGYSLDGQTNVTNTGNTTLPSLLDGAHYVVVYANDTAGNMGASNTVYFTVDITPPSIAEVSQTPPKNNVLPEDEVKINATVTDYVSEVKQVTLNYTNGNGTWITVKMTNLEGDVWNATIPTFPYCTNVTYTIIAEDNVGNIISTEEMEYEYQYLVIPEFPSFLIVPLFMTATLLAVMVYKRKRSTS